MAGLSARRPLGALLLTWLAVAGFLGVILWFMAIQNRPPGFFTRDIFSIADLPVYTAIVTHATVFLWTVTAAICLFSGWILWRLPGRRAPAGFLLVGAGISFVLLLDDFFLIHEWLLPQRFGFPEQGTFALYLALVLWYVMAFRQVILAAEPELLLLAGMLFAAALGLDILESLEFVPVRWFPEEACKLMGAATWCLFFARAAAREVRAALPPPARRAPASP
ncbi:MAG: hypothetical protein ABR559_01600 [Gemmatimonadota bacterium]